MKRQKPRTLPLGSVSHGTMRPEDLIPRFLDTADGVRMSKTDRDKVREMRRTVETLADDCGGCGAYHPPGFSGDCRDDENRWTDPEFIEAKPEDADELLTELFDLLGSYCPPFCYFGAHEGDGSDYGCWPSVEAVESDPDVWRDPDDGSKVPADARYRMVVSDHGNVTLYYRNGREVWGVVV